MKKQLIIITHEHRHGVDTHLCEIWDKQHFDLDKAIKKLGINYEPDRADENINWDITEPHDLTDPKELRHILFLSKEDDGRTYFEDGLDAFIEECNDPDEYVEFETYEYTGNEVELMEKQNAWDEYAWISEEDYNKLKNL